VSDADDGLVIRAARDGDVGAILAMIVELAEYERAPDQVVGTPALLREALFGTSPSCEALVAQRGGETIGFALFHGTFSTWTCRPGIWLEDLFVPERHRRGGVGGRLLSALAEIAVQRGCPRLEWVALDWNTPALGFYDQLGAQPLSDWIVHRLDGDELESVAARAS
jgi:GNAT superfamily N-acetyltransferase